MTDDSIVDALMTIRVHENPVTGVWNVSVEFKGIKSRELAEGLAAMVEQAICKDGHPPHPIQAINES